jgi:hypothetical protein
MITPLIEDKLSSTSTLWMAASVRTWVGDVSYTIHSRCDPGTLVTAPTQVGFSHPLLAATKPPHTRQNTQTPSSIAAWNILSTGRG